MRIRIRKPHVPQENGWDPRLDELDGLETYLPLDKQIHVSGYGKAAICYIQMKPKKIWPDKVSRDLLVAVSLNWIECLDPLPPILEKYRKHFFAVAPPSIGSLGTLTLTNLHQLG